VSQLEQIHFLHNVRSLFPDLFLRSSVLEIGSIKLDDSVHELFDSCNHTNVALTENPIADLSELAQQSVRGGKLFDVAISHQSLKNDPQWRKTFSKMCEVTRDLIILTVSIAPVEHSENSAGVSPSASDHRGQPTKLSIEEFVSLSLNKHFTEYEISHVTASNELYFWGLLKSASTPPSRKRTDKSEDRISLNFQPRVDCSQKLDSRKSDPNWYDAIGEFVDTEWYLWTNPDVAQAGVDPVTHFIKYGMSENRNPNRFFNSFFYLVENEDVAQAGIPAFAHFLEFGRFENRSCHHHVNIEWCVLNAFNSGYDDYFSWMYDNCLRSGFFPFNPAEKFYLAKPLTDVNAISSYWQYLADMKNDILTA
jgi:hypothetical protein